MSENKFFIREAVGEGLYNIGKENKNIITVTADLLGTSRIKKFAEEFPSRSFNVGIAEQNMVSFAAGLAHEGYMPFVFSMAPFISMRACEQCRDDVAYANLNVRFVAHYAGFSGGISGATHWALEDCAIMGSIGNMTVIEISDPMQAKSALSAAVDYNGPIYFRVGVIPVERIYDDDYKFIIGKASVPIQGNDGAFICSGVIVQYAVKAAQIIKEQTGKTISVVDMSTIKPIDKSAIEKAAQTNNIIVAQDHNIIGGLGYYVAAVLAEKRLNPKFKIVGANDEFIPMAHADYIYHKLGLDADGLVHAMLRMLNS